MNKQKMNILFKVSGLLSFVLIFWTALGFLMDLSSTPIVLPLCITSIIVFFITGFLKNREEKRKFREYLNSQKENKEVQEKLKNERIPPGDKTGRTGVKTYFKEKNTGVIWTPASVHGAVAHRKKRKPFLPKNR